MKKRVTEKLIYSALFSCLIFIGTQFIKIPLVVGYLNVGDCFVLLSGWIIGGGWAILGAGIGAGLADILSGYVIYAPVTIVIKGVMAFLAYIGYKIVAKKKKPTLILGYTVSGVIAELIMATGYYLFEGALYGFATASVSLIGNLLQGAIAVIAGTTLIAALEKTGMVKKIRK